MRSLLLKVRSSFRTLGIAAFLGIVAGISILPLADAPSKWLMVPTGLAVGAFALLASPNPRRTLLAIFLLSLQFDLRIWLLHGHALTDGLYIPVSALPAAALAGWIILGDLQTRQITFQGPGPLRSPIALLLGAIAISVALSSEHFAGLVSLTEHLYYILFYLLILNVVKTTADFEFAVRLLLVVACTQALTSFAQAYLGMTFSPTGEVSEADGVLRPTGTVSANPAGFTSFLTPPLMIAVAILLTKNTKPRILVLLTAVLGATAVSLSFTRAAWVGLGIGFCVIGFMLFVRRRLNVPRFALGILGAALGFAALVPTMLQRLTPDYQGQSSFEERVGLMQIAVRMIAEKPIFGFGSGSYGFIFKQYAYGLNQWLFTVHNEFLLRAAETGVVGLFAFCWILWRAQKLAADLSHTNSPILETVAIGWLGALWALVWQMQWVPWTGFLYNAMLWVTIGLVQAGVAFSDREAS